MAVSVLNRPGGYILSGASADITIYNSSVVGDSNNRAVVYHPSHGYSIDNQVVYIKTPSEQYNGFRRIITGVSVDYYYIILDEESTTYIPFVSQVNGTSYAITSFGYSVAWSCVHLPIAYKLSNTLWPVNSADTIRSISSVTDSNGYCAISTSGDIKATGSAAALEFVKIDSSPSGSTAYDGVYQIISYTNDTTFVINLPYSSDADTVLTDANIQYYYNNYVVKVRVYGGLASGHYWEDQKPYELLTTLELVPDENNEVLFSVHEILKKQISINNNLLKATLPNNIDAFTQFYIEYGEEYDDSDGTTLSRSTVSYTDDSSLFEGYAVNAMLPFKNVYSGALSEYILVSTSHRGKFLTNFEEPSLFEGKYFDLSFIVNTSDPVAIFEELYSSGSRVDSSITDISQNDEGVYRVQTSDADCDYDSMNVTILRGESLPIPSAWTTFSDPFFSKTATTFVSTGITANAYSPALSAVLNSTTYRFSIRVVSNTNNAGLIGISFEMYDGLLLPGNPISNTYNLEIPNSTTAADYVVELTTTAAASAPELLILFTNAISATVTITMPEYYYSPTSETKTINIDCDCENQSLHLSWLNNLGGFDHWNFTAEKEYPIEIGNTGETRKNIFPTWPQSYSEFADTIRKQTFRESRKQVLVRSQHLTLEQVEAISYIKSSVLVQIVNSIYDRRTVLVDNQSWTKYKESDKKDTYTIQFLISYTDDIPAQSV